MQTINDRMKHNYEEVSKTRLTRKTPVIIRLDGKAFHTFTKGLKRPYDTIFHDTMNATMKYLCEHIQGCKLGYTQSDEITLLLTDFDTITTDAWFDYEVQKMCSISASMATLAFNKAFREFYEKYAEKDLDSDSETSSEVWEYIKILTDKLDQAMFDSRCFNIPEDEVVNCFIWRQQDATRNAIQMLGQTYFSPKELHKKKSNEIQDMLMLQKGINFNDMPTEFKRGVCCRKVSAYSPKVPGDKNSGIDFSTERKKWYVDKDIPIFTQDRDYILRCMTKEI